MIKSKINYAGVSAIDTVSNKDFGIFWGYDPDELVLPPTVRMLVRTYMNNNVDDNEYELCEPELIRWLSERLK